MAFTPTWFQELDALDDATVQLMLTLQLQDAEELVTSGDDRDKAAFELYRNEIQDFQCIRVFEHEDTSLPEADIDLSINSVTSAPALEESLAKDDHALEFKCIICGDRYDSDHCCAVPCGHHYCDEDLETLFRSAMTDRELYPPKCCRQIIAFDEIQQFLSEALVNDFEAKREELDDLKPTYCQIPTCSTYIGADGKDSGIATCPDCAEKTCILCKRAAHDGDCEEDAEIQETLRLAEQEGWRRCPSCERMVELERGCHHITCLCHAEWCYLCAATWKQCACPVFDEHRLLQRGRQIAARERGANLGEVVRNLRANHDCIDHIWGRVDGANNCDHCNGHLPDYIFRCRTCRTQKCRRCRFNR